MDLLHYYRHYPGRPTYIQSTHLSLPTDRGPVPLLEPSQTSCPPLVLLPRNLLDFPEVSTFLRLPFPSMTCVWSRTHTTTPTTYDLVPRL